MTRPQAVPASWRERNRQQTRDAILRAAEVLMLRDGVAGTSMVEVAQLAGVSDTTVFNYFKTKTDLLDGLIEARSSIRGLAEIVDGRPTGESAAESLRRGLDQVTPPDMHFDSAAVAAFLRAIKGDPALWGAQLRAGFQQAEELAAAFARRGAGELVARLAANAFMAAMVVVIGDLPDDCTGAELVRRVRDVIDALGRAWPELEH